MFPQGFARGDYPMSIGSTDASDCEEKFLPARQVWSRYGVSDMTLWRWLRNAELGFPQPIRIGRYRYWRVADLVSWERSR